MCGARRRARARVGLMVATGCSAYLALARDDARPVRRLPDVEPYDDFRPSRWCHGDILQSSGQSEALPRHSHYLAVAPAPGSFLSVVRSCERLRWQRPRALFGAEADGHPGTPDRRPLGAWPYRRQCAECSPPKFIGGLSWTVMGWRIDRAINGRNRPAYPLGQRERAIRLLDGIGLMDYEGINGLA